MADEKLPTYKPAGNRIGQRYERHGLYRNPIYRIWYGMLRRCYDPQKKGYCYYGGRGIIVCDRWRQSLLAFYQDMGPRPKGHEIDRIDTNGNYEPSNCRWLTVTENKRNRRDCVWLEHNGERLHVREWAERTGISWSTIKRRIREGMTAADALTLPVTDPYRQGEQSHLSTLTEACVRQIFAMRVRRMSQAAIAKHFGVGQGTISAVLNRQSWGHLEGLPEVPTRVGRGEWQD